MTKIAEMRATYFLPRGLASSGFSVQKGSWHPSKCTWLKISSVILKVTKREPHVLGLLSLLASYYPSWGAWKKMLLLRWMESSSKVLLHGCPYLWGYRSMQISCRTQLLKDGRYERTSTGTITHLLELFILRRNTEKRCFGPSASLLVSLTSS